MSEQIYTFTEEEVEKMLKSGEMRLLTSPEPVKTQSDHEKALEKAKKLFGSEFNDVWTLEIGGKTIKRLKQALRKARINISPNAWAMLNSTEFTTLPDRQKIELAKIKVSDLGFNDRVSTDLLYERLQSLGLKLSPPEVAVYQRLEDKSQTYTDPWYFIAMEPITTYVSTRLVFVLNAYSFGYSLECGATAGYFNWDSENRLIVSL